MKFIYILILSKDSNQQTKDTKISQNSTFRKKSSNIIMKTLSKRFDILSLAFM